MQDNEHYIINRKRVFRKVHFGRIVIAITAVCFVVALCVAFFGRSSDKFKVAAKTYYFVQMGKFTAALDAENAAQTIKNSGGAGYVLNDGSLRCMAAVYTSAKDADTVILRLTEQGKEAQSFALSSNSLKIPIYKEKEDTKKLHNSILMVSNIFDRLYRLVCELDGALTTESYVLLCVTKELEGMEKAMETVAALPKTDSTKALEKHYTETNNCLREIFDQTIKNGVSIKVKYALCGLAESYIKCLKNLM